MVVVGAILSTDEIVELKLATQPAAVPPQSERNSKSKAPLVPTAIGGKVVPEYTPNNGAFKFEPL